VHPTGVVFGVGVDVGRVIRLGAAGTVVAFVDAYAYGISIS